MAHRPKITGHCQVRQKRCQRLLSDGAGASDTGIGISLRSTKCGMDVTWIDRNWLSGFGSLFYGKGVETGTVQSRIARGESDAPVPRSFTPFTMTIEVLLWTLSANEPYQLVTSSGRILTMV
jgi:hypothetical protein